MERAYKKILQELLLETESNFENSICFIKDENNYGDDKNRGVSDEGENAEHYYANKSCLMHFDKFLDGYFQCYDVAYDITGDDSIAKAQQDKYLLNNKLTLTPLNKGNIDYHSSVGESFDFLGKILSEETDERLFRHIKENIDEMSQEYFNSSIYPEYLFAPFYNSLNCDFYKDKVGIDVNEFFQTNPHATTMFYSLKKRLPPDVKHNIVTYGVSRFSDELFNFFKETYPPIDVIRKISPEEKRGVVNSFITNTRDLEKLAILFDVCNEVEKIPDSRQMDYLESRIQGFPSSSSPFGTTSKIFESAKEQLHKIESRFLIAEKINAKIEDREEDITPITAPSFKL